MNLLVWKKKLPCPYRIEERAKEKVCSEKWTETDFCLEDKKKPYLYAEPMRIVPSETSCGPKKIFRNCTVETESPFHLGAMWKKDLKSILKAIAI